MMPSVRELLNELRDDYTITREELNRLARNGKKGTQEYKKLRKRYEELGKKFDELLWTGEKK